jgi:monoamine oxidase
MTGTADYEVAIIGAGAAGLAAAKTLMTKGKKFILLEASHRVGGRAYTEELLPGMPFDLGCHWLHSASLNPFVKVADELGVTYTTEGFERSFFADGQWANSSELAERSTFMDRQYAALAEAVAGGGDTSVYEATEREHALSPDFDYFMSINSSADVDEISVKDLLSYNDTEENWPLKDGYGTLVTRYGADIPVTLNAAVSDIDWSGTAVKLTTPQGVISADHVLITVSTGILGAGDIRFSPQLPDWKQAAIAALPVGNHNRIALAFDREVFGDDVPYGGLIRDGGTDVMSIRIKPFGFNCVVGLTGGRFADWLERAGQAASIDFLGEKLKAVFGNDIAKHASAQIVTAWRGDPWTKGAYSCALPGEAHQRAQLAKSVGERVHFAGEATSAEFFSTAHGAHLSGIDAANRL